MGPWSPSSYRMARRLAHQVSEFGDGRVSDDAAEVKECAIGPRVFRALPLDGGEHLAHLKRALHGNDDASADVVALVLNRHPLIVGDRPPGGYQRIAEAALSGSMTRVRAGR
jgi:hypothetical protein